MGNRRISQLNNLPAATVASNDLFIISDESLPESKNITAMDLKTYILNGGNITASLSGTASWANTAVYALNSPIAAQVNYATSSLSSSYASSSINSTSSSYAKTSSFSITASYALVTGLTSSFAANSNNATSASYLLYVGNNNGTAFNSISASNALLATTALNANVASLANTASVALVALSMVNPPLNQSGNQSANTVYSSYIWNSGSNDVGVSMISSKSIHAQIDNVVIVSPYRDYDNVSISGRGLISLINKLGSALTELDYAPTLSLIIQDLSTGITQSLATQTFSTNLITGASPHNLRFYLTGSVNCSGSYRIYLKSAFFDDGDNDFGMTFSSPPVFRVSSKANEFLVSSQPTKFGNSSNNYPSINTDVDGITFNYSASWNVLGTPISSIGTDTLPNLIYTNGNTIPNSSSYITYLDNNGNQFDTLTGLWTLSSLKAASFNNSRATYIDGIPSSLISMSCHNCRLTSLPLMGSLLNPTQAYSMSYLDMSNQFSGSGNSISDISTLPATMSYLNLSGVYGLNTFGAALPKGIKYLYVRGCNLSQDDLDELTSMLVSEVVASGTTHGTLDIGDNIGNGNLGTITAYNIGVIGSGYSNIYNWTISA